MKSGIVKSARLLLIELGKFAPFIVCFIVLISYCESLYALITNDYLIYDNELTLNKAISWFIGRYLTYNIITIISLVVISIAVETCIWNKLCIAYLAFQLYEKHYFMTIELYEDTIYCIVIANIIIMILLLYKGIKQITFINLKIIKD